MLEIEGLNYRTGKIGYSLPRFVYLLLFFLRKPLLTLGFLCLYFFQNDHQCNFLYQNEKLHISKATIVVNVAVAATLNALMFSGDRGVL